MSDEGITVIDWQSASEEQEEDYRNRIRIGRDNLYTFDNKPFTGKLIDPDGGIIWYENGRIHRTDGPAVEDSNGSKRWFIDDKEYTEDEFKKEVKKRGIKPTPEYFKNLL